MPGKAATFEALGYREPLRRIRDQIQPEGSFVAHAQRFVTPPQRPADNL
jgi:hypothetical protein